VDTERRRAVHTCPAHLEGGELCGSTALIIETRDGRAWQVFCPNGHQYLPVPGSVHTICARNIVVDSY
jgi:hypothetical protein